MGIIFGVVIVLAVLAVVPKMMAENAYDKQQKKHEEAKRRKEEEWKNYEKQQKKAFEDKLENYRKKWEKHPLFLAGLEACSLEVDRLYKAVAEGNIQTLDSKYRENSFGGERCYSIGISGGITGFSVETRTYGGFSYSDFGYSNIDFDQSLALTLALNSGLREKYKNNPDILFDLVFYQNNDGFEHQVLVGVRKKQEDNNFKSVVL